MTIQKILTVLLLAGITISVCLPTVTVAATPLAISGAGSATLAWVSTPVVTPVPPGQAPISTAEPPFWWYPIATAKPAPNPLWYSDMTYLDDRSTAIGLIHSYFNAINRQEYLRAYTYWRTPAASLGQFEKFAAGFSQTTSVKVRIGQISEGVITGQIYYSVPLLIKAMTTTGERQRFVACYVLQLSQPSVQGVPPFVPLGIKSGTARLVTKPGNGGALLASACSGSGNNGSPMKSAPTTNREDTSAYNYLDDRSDPNQVMRSLVNAINRKEYVRAYSYWENIAGSANVPPFEQFARGYAETENVHLMVGLVQSDAGAGQFYYSVPVVMIASTTRGLIQTFSGCYVLHLSNPAVQATPPFKPLTIRSAEVHQYSNDVDLVSLLARACKP